MNTTTGSQTSAAQAAVIGAGVLWGLIGAMTLMLSACGLDAIQIQGIRIGYAAVICITIILIYKPGLLKIRLRDAWMFVGTGIISTAFFGVCYFYTGIHSETSTAVVLLYTSPIFVMILSALLFREKITGYKLFALALTFGGCICVAGLSAAESHLTPLTMATGLASGFFYALYSIFGKYALEKYDTLTVTTYTFIFGSAALLPFVDVRMIFETYQKHPEAIGWSLGVSLLSTVCSYFLYSWGLKRIESGRAAILVTSEPLVASAIGIILFHESHGPVKLLGMVMILSAILVLQKKKN